MHDGHEERVEGDQTYVELQQNTIVIQELFIDYTNYNIAVLLNVLLVKYLKCCSRELLPIGASLSTTPAPRSTIPVVL